MPGKPQELKCRIASVTDLGNQVRKVELTAYDPLPSFKAGQYLEIFLPDGKKCPFSIANAPLGQTHLELHIRPTPESKDSEVIESLIDSKADLRIAFPKGNCFMERMPERDVILIAASTGITQMKSIIEFLKHHAFAHSVSLYWGVLFADDLYLSPSCDKWKKELSSFQYVPVVSEPERSPDWNGRTGLVGEAVLEDFDELQDKDIFVSGSPGMVYATFDQFVAKGMPEENMFSDVFAYAPRS